MPDLAKSFEERIRERAAARAARPAYEDELGLDPSGAAKELRRRGASPETFARESKDLYVAEQAKQKQAEEAALSGERFDSHSSWRDAAAANVRAVPGYEAFRGIKQGAELGLDLLDTPGRVARQALTAYGNDQPVTVEDLGKAAVAPFWRPDPSGNTSYTQGNFPDFIKATETSEKLPLQAINLIGQIGGRAAGGLANFASMGLLGQVPGVQKEIESLGGKFVKGALVDPLTYVSSLPSGARRAGAQVATALERGGVKAGADVAGKTARAFTELSDTTKLVPEIRELYTVAGGSDLKHLDAVAGKNLENLGESGLRLGLPYGIGGEHASVAPGEALGNLAARLSGGRISPSQGTLPRLIERLEQRASYGLPKHVRGEVNARRAAAKNLAYADDLEGLKDFRETVLPLADRLSGARRAEIANQAMNPSIIPDAQKFAAPGELNFVKELRAYQARRGVDLTSADPVELVTSALSKKHKTERIKEFEAWVDKELPGAPPEIRRAAETVFDQSMAPRSNIGKIAQYIMGRWKAWRLSTPQFSMLNGIEDSTKAVAYGVSPKVLPAYGRMGEKVADNVVILKASGSGKTYTAGDLRAIFKEAGTGLGYGQKYGLRPAEGRPTRILDAVATGGLAPIVRKTENLRDEAFRELFIMDRLQKGYSPKAAGNELRKVLFDNNIPALNENLQKAIQAISTIRPFFRYTARTARIAPELIARNPGIANIPLHLGQAAVSDAETKDIPANRHRTPGAYLPLGRESRDFVSRAMEKISGDAIDPGYQVTLTPRGSLTEVASDSLFSGDPDAIGGNAPWVQLPYQAITHVGPYGQPDQPLTVQGAVGSLVGRGLQLEANAVARHVFGSDESVIGPPVDYRQDPAYSTQQEALAVLNATLPWRTSLTSPSDVEREKAESQTASYLGLRLRKASAKKRVDSQVKSREKRERNASRRQRKP